MPYAIPCMTSTMAAVHLKGKRPVHVPLSVRSAQPNATATGVPQENNVLSMSSATGRSVRDRMLMISPPIR